MRTNVCVCYVCIGVYVGRLACVYVRMHVYVSARMCVCVCVCLFVLLLFHGVIYDDYP